MAGERAPKESLYFRSFAQKHSFKCLSSDEVRSYINGKLFLKSLSSLCIE